MTVQKAASPLGTEVEDPDEAVRRLRRAVPSGPQRVLPRPRLMAVLDRARDVPLTVVSGTAGSGKTALVATWVGGRAAHEATAWLELADGEIGAAQLWSDLVACVRQHGGEAARAAPALRTAVHPSAELAVAVASLDRPVTVVLDGGELVSADLADDLDFVLRHSGGLLHLVMLTRVDPALPLHRYRLEDTVNEVRQADLAFTEEETAALVALHGVDLTGSAVRALHRRTRGWAAALRFAIMVLERSAQPDVAVRELAGDKGNIAEYLMAEVLDGLPEETRTLLMRTSIVDVLRPGLIEALAGPSAPPRLEALTRANLLVEGVPDRPGCYRYHPLLRDLLRAELAHRLPGQRPELHLTAAAWFAQQHDIDHAVALAVEVGDWLAASRFVVDEMALGRPVPAPPSDEVVRVMRDLPRGVDDPAAGVVRAAVALASGAPETCARELAAVRTSSTRDAGSSVRAAVELLDSARARRSPGRSAGPVVPMQRRPPATIPTDTPPPGQVIETLTTRELEVLGHLAELLSTEEIAEVMFVSVNTIRTHVRSILRKLAVTRRNAAVRRGRALGLLR